jgi:hypothetical protein
LKYSPPFFMLHHHRVSLFAIQSLLRFFWFIGSSKSIVSQSSTQMQVQCPSRVVHNDYYSHCSLSLIMPQSVVLFGSS